MTTPRTYAAAVKVAETITPTELDDLISGGNAVTIIAKRCTPKHAFDARLHIGIRSVFIGFEFCNRNGFTSTGTASVRDTVFNFYNLGRIVRVAREVTA